MSQILFSLSLSPYIPSAMDYGQSCDLFRLIQMVSALNSTSSLASNYPSSDNLCSYPNSGHPGPINNTVQQAELTFSKQNNTDGQVVESGDTPTRQLISKWRNAAWLRGLEQKEESAGIKKKSQGAFCPQLKCSNELAIERVCRVPKILTLLTSFTWANPRILDCLYS